MHRFLAPQYWVISFALTLLAVPADAQQRGRDRRPAPEEEKSDEVTYLYKIQKRGGGGQFSGWFLAVDPKAKVTRGVSTGLVTTWHSKDSTSTWEVRPAGEFNGVECVYLINKGDSKFEGWYLGLDEKNQTITIHETAEGSTTKWLLRWLGREGKYDLFQLRNAGLTPLKGAMLGMTVTDQDHSTGAARNVVVSIDQKDPLTLWSLRRLTGADLDEIQPNY